VLAVLREPYWLRALLLVVFLSAVCVYLGRWQWGRHEGKVAIADRIAQNYDATPAALAALLPDPGAPLPSQLEWRPVRLHGTYLTDRTVLVRNRPLDGVFGYEIVVPFRPDNGPVLLVDRGWVVNGASGARPDVVPPPPAGEVGVTARLRPTEPPLDRAPPPGQELRIDVPRITAALGGTVVTQAYGVLAAEDPAPVAAPTLLGRPDGDLGPHLAYAVQWWLGAVVVYVLLVVYAAKEATRRREEALGGPVTVPAPADAQDDGQGHGADAVHGVAPTAPEAPPVRGAGSKAAERWRSRRGGELSDEEWEDLADAAAQARARDGVVRGGALVDDDHAGAGAQRHVDE